MEKMLARIRETKPFYDGNKYIKLIENIEQTAEGREFLSYLDYNDINSAFEMGEFIDENEQIQELLHNIVIDAIKGHNIEALIWGQAIYKLDRTEIAIAFLTGSDYLSNINPKQSRSIRARIIELMNQYGIKLPKDPRNLFEKIKNFDNRIIKNVIRRYKEWIRTNSPPLYISRIIIGEPELLKEIYEGTPLFAELMRIGGLIDSHDFVGLNKMLAESPFKQEVSIYLEFDNAHLIETIYDLIHENESLEQIKILYDIMSPDAVINDELFTCIMLHKRNKNILPILNTPINVEFVKHYRYAFTDEEFAVFADDQIKKIIDMILDYIEDGDVDSIKLWFSTLYDNYDIEQYFKKHEETNIMLINTLIATGHFGPIMYMVDRGNVIASNELNNYFNSERYNPKIIEEKEKFNLKMADINQYSNLVPNDNLSAEEIERIKKNVVLFEEWQKTIINDRIIAETAYRSNDRQKIENVYKNAAQIVNTLASSAGVPDTLERDKIINSYNHIKTSIDELFPSEQLSAETIDRVKNALDSLKNDMIERQLLPASEYPSKMTNEEMKSQISFLLQNMSDIRHTHFTHNFKDLLANSAITNDDILDLINSAAEINRNDILAIISLFKNEYIHLLAGQETHIKHGIQYYNTGSLSNSLIMGTYLFVEELVWSMPADEYLSKKEIEEMIKMAQNMRKGEEERQQKQKEKQLEMQKEKQKQKEIQINSLFDSVKNIKIGNFVNNMIDVYKQYPLGAFELFDLMEKAENSKRLDIMIVMAMLIDSSDVNLLEWLDCYIDEWSHDDVVDRNQHKYNTIRDCLDGLLNNRDVLPENKRIVNEWIQKLINEPEKYINPAKTVYEVAAPADKLNDLAEKMNDLAEKMINTMNESADKFAPSADKMTKMIEIEKLTNIANEMLKELNKSNRTVNAWPAETSDEIAAPANKMIDVFTKSADKLINEFIQSADPADEMVDEFVNSTIDDLADPTGRMYNTLKHLVPDEVAHVTDAGIRQHTSRPAQRVERQTLPARPVRQTHHGRVKVSIRRPVVTGIVRIQEDTSVQLTLPAESEVVEQPPQSARPALMAKL